METIEFNKPYEFDEIKKIAIHIDREDLKITYGTGLGKFYFIDKTDRDFDTPFAVDFKRFIDFTDEDEAARLLQSPMMYKHSYPIEDQELEKGGSMAEGGGVKLGMKGSVLDTLEDAGYVFDVNELSAYFRGEGYKEYDNIKSLVDQNKLDEAVSILKKHIKISSGGSMAEGGEISDTQIVTTIRNQIGRMALFMLGAYDIYADGNALVFKIKGSPNWKQVRIELNERDLYDITFKKWRKLDLSDLEEKTLKDIYADNMHEIIEIETGLYTSLAKGGSMAEGGVGKTPEQIWNGWNEQERIKFIHDQTGKQHTTVSIEEIAKKNYKFIPIDIKNKISKHSSVGSMATGGGVDKFWNPRKQEYSKGEKVIYKNVEGIFNKYGVVEEILIQDGMKLYNVRGEEGMGGTYLADELRVVKSSGGSMAGGEIQLHLDDLYKKAGNSVDYAMQLYAGELGIFNLYYGHRVDPVKKAKWRRGYDYLIKKYKSGGSMAEGGEISLMVKKYIKKDYLDIRSIIIRPIDKELLSQHLLNKKHISDGMVWDLGFNTIKWGLIRTHKGWIFVDAEFCHLSPMKENEIIVLSLFGTRVTSTGHKGRIQALTDQDFTIQQLIDASLPETIIGEWSDKIDYNERIKRNQSVLLNTIEEAIKPPLPELNAEGGKITYDKAIQAAYDEAIQTAWDDINSWSDSDIAEFLDIPEKDVDYGYKELAVQKLAESYVEQGHFAKGGGVGRKVKFEIITDSRFNNINLIDAYIMVLDSILNIPEIKFKHSDKEFLDFRDGTKQYRVTYYLQKDNSITWDNIYGLINLVYAPYYEFISGGTQIKPSYDALKSEKERNEFLKDLKKVRETYYEYWGKENPYKKEFWDKTFQKAKELNYNVKSFHFAKGGKINYVGILEKIDTNVCDKLNIESGCQLDEDIDLQKKYVEEIKKEMLKNNIPFRLDETIYDDLEDANFHTLNGFLFLEGYYDDWWHYDKGIENYTLSEYYKSLKSEEQTPLEYFNSLNIAEITDERLRNFIVNEILPHPALDKASKTSENFIEIKSRIETRFPKALQTHRKPEPEKTKEPEPEMSAWMLNARLKLLKKMLEKSPEDNVLKTRIKLIEKMRRRNLKRSVADEPKIEDFQ